MNEAIFVVHARKWGENETHSYIVGVYDNEHVACFVADREEDYRGGKYGCQVTEWQINETLENYPKVVRKPFKRKESLHEDGL